MLTSGDSKKYLRQIILPEIGEEGQSKLKNAKVLVVGAGGLGCPVLQYLCSTGVGTIGIMDYDRIDETNLHRQVLYGDGDIGKYKVDIAEARLRIQNPDCKIIPIGKAIDRSNAIEVINNFDIVVDATDNFSAKYLMNDACVIAGKPLVFGSIFKFEGQVSVFNFQGGPTYRCVFPDAPDNSPNCSEIGVMGTLPGIIGTLQAHEVIKIITGCGETLSGKLLTVDINKMEFQIFSIVPVSENLKITSLAASYEFESCSDPEIRELSAAELKKAIEKKSMEVVDVRECSEFREFHISSENIPVSEVLTNPNRIDRNRQVAIICSSGMRSRNVIDILQKKHGYKNLFNLTGGLLSWKKMNS